MSFSIFPHLHRAVKNPHPSAHANKMMQEPIVPMGSQRAAEVLPEGRQNIRPLEVSWTHHVGINGHMPLQLRRQACPG